MSKLTKFFRRRQGYLSGRRPEDLWRELIARHAAERSFVDVGCMWKVDGAYAFHALANGASAVTGIDMLPATEEFRRRNAEVGDRVRFFQADLNDRELATRLGQFDVVFCSGVLYHVPDPIFSLLQLRRLCRQTLVLTSASITERSTPNAAIFLPCLDDDARRKLNFTTPKKNKKLALDTPFVPEQWYANWFWLPTPSCLRALVTVAGFEVVDLYRFRRVTTVVAKPAKVWAPEPR